MRIFTGWVLAATMLGSAAACSSDSGNGSGDADLSAPTDFVAEALEGAAHLTWHDNSDEAEFMIERRMEGGDWMTIATVPFDTTQYHDAGLDPTMTYTYRILAMSKDGKHGPASSEANCMPMGGGMNHMAGHGG